jgi:hypothetical protein
MHISEWAEQYQFIDGPGLISDIIGYVIDGFRWHAGRSEKRLGRHSMQCQCYFCWHHSMIPGHYARCVRSGYVASVSLLAGNEENEIEIVKCQDCLKMRYELSNRQFMKLFKLPQPLKVAACVKDEASFMQYVKEKRLL